MRRWGATLLALAVGLQPALPALVFAQESPRSYWNLQDPAHTEERAVGEGPPDNPPGTNPEAGTSASESAKEDADRSVIEAAEQAARSVDALYRRGERARRRGDRDTAERSFLAVLNRAPYHALTLIGLGKLRMNSDPSRAREDLETARQVHPSVPEVHTLLGQVYEKLGRDLDAAESYRRAIVLDPKQYEANARLRGVLRRMRSSRSTVDVAADSFYAHPNLASLTLFGRLVMEQLQPRQAVLEFEELRRRAPELPEVDLWLARAQHAAGNPAEELTAYRRYLEQRPDATGVRLTLVERLSGQGWYAEAATALQSMDAADPGAVGRLPPDMRARITFIRSRLYSAQQEPGRAGEALRLAGEQGFATDELQRAFAEDLGLFPQSAELWFAYGNWLLAAHKEEAACDALVQAGRLGNTQRRLARATLQHLRETGVAQVAATVAMGELAWAEQDSDAALKLLAEVPPGHRLDHRASLLRGLIHRSRGELDASLDAFLRYVLFFDDPRDLVYARGNVLWQLGRTAEAIAVWNRNPDVLLRHPQVLLRVADLHQQAGDVPAEIAAREQIIQVLPVNAENRTRLGTLYLQQGRKMEALLLWERLLAQRPRDAELLLKIGHGWLELGDAAKAMPVLQRASQLRALDVETSLALARELYRTRRYEAALRVYWNVYQMQPTQLDARRVLPELVLSLPASVEQRTAAARVAEETGRYDLAAELLEGLLHESPMDNALRLQLAGNYLRRGDHARAEAVLTAPEATAGSSERGLELMATVQRKLSRKKDLAVTLGQLHALRPSDGALLHERALLLADLNRPKEAQPLLRAALEAAPRDVPLLMAMAETNLALGNEDSAKSNLLAVIAEDPNHDLAQRRVIDLQLKREQWEDAARLLERWIAVHPQDGTARFNLVIAYLKLFRKDAAGPHFQALRRIQPNRARQLEPYFR